MTAPNIQPGHVARHTPRNAGAQGREAAVVDIAQDLLLAHLQKVGILNDVVIKGGTAIRKLYAGKEGRFSLDLDFSFASIDADQDKVVDAFIGEVNGLVIGPFSYGVKERRGKWSVTFGSRFVSSPTLATKLDFSPAPWLDPVTRTWIPMSIHKQYGKDLPSIQTTRLEENIAEKIARLFSVCQLDVDTDNIHGLAAQDHGFCNCAAHTGRQQAVFFGRSHHRVPAIA